MNTVMRGTGMSLAFQCLMVLGVALVMTLVMSEAAQAQSINLNPITSFITSITTALTGNLGKAIATLALVGVAITWFFGIIDFRQAMWVVVAIVFVGSASLIVNSLWSTTAS